MCILGGFFTICSDKMQHLLIGEVESLILLWIFWIKILQGIIRPLMDHVVGAFIREHDAG